MDIIAMFGGLDSIGKKVKKEFDAKGVESFLVYFEGNEMKTENLDFSVKELLKELMKDQYSSELIKSFLNKKQNGK